MKPSRAPLAEVARVTQRLAVLLAAGVAPTSAWEYLAPDSPIAASVDPFDVADSLVAATATARPLERGAWRGLAAAWSVATDAGAPLAASLRDYSASLRSLADAQRDIEVALAAPVATARMVMALPVVGVLFGMALGFNTVATLFTTAPGWVCLGIGAVLMFAASRWNRRLVAAAQPTDAAPGIECDLMAIAVSGGGSLARARKAVETATARFGITPRLDRIEPVIELSRRAGVPAADLLRAEADELRRAARANAQRQAAALSVRLMLPLGLCVLPAFMVLGVFPLLLAVVSSTVGTF